MVTVYIDSFNFYILEWKARDAEIDDTVEEET